MKKSILLLALFSSSALAGTPQDMYINITENVVLTVNLEKPCTMWSVPKDHVVMQATIVDKSINKTAYGCWEMEESPNGLVVHADLVSPESKSYFSFRYPAEQFSPVPNL